jgi:sec-independent protein translocase protein TatC
MSPQPPPNSNQDPFEEQSFVSHLVELRARLLKSLGCVLVVFLSLSYFSRDIYSLLARPLMEQLPAGSTMIATEVAAPFFAPFKLTLIVAIFLSIPYVLYQLWAFVAPGLYRHEQRLVLPLLISSSLLFYVGIAFAYFVVFPLMFKFFTATAPEGVTVMTDISRYLDFVLTMFLAFGFSFEVPIATLLLIHTGIITVDSLVAKRPYIIVGAFVIGMILTPPDVISQVLLAVPIWLLFEIGILLAPRILVFTEEARPSTTDREGQAQGGRPIH